MRSCLIILMLLTIASTAFAQSVDTAWVRTFSGESTTAVGVTKMDLDSAGNPILIGWSTTGASAADFMVLKFYSTGDTAWVRNFDCPEHHSDRATAISIGIQQIMAISGNCNRYLLDSGYAATIVLSADGMPLNTIVHPMETIVWNRMSLWSLPIGLHDLTVVGYTVSSPEGSKLKMQKSSFGFVAYSTEVPNLYASSLVVSANQSKFYVAGNSGSLGSLSFSTVAVSASDLDTNWLRDEPTGFITSISPALIAAFGNDGAVVSGGCRSMLWTPHEYHWMTYRYNALGTRLWSGRDTTCGGTPKAICIDKFGNTIVAGQAQASYACTQYVADTNQILILKYDSGGELTWNVRYTAPGMTTHDVVACAVDSLGNLYVTANVLADVTETDNDIFVMRLNPDREIDWTYTYASAGGERDLATAMCFDQQGNLYIGGTTGADRVLLIKLVQGSFVDVDDSETLLVPAAFQLSQNYPNPFNPSTEFWYSLATPAHAIVEIFAINGALVRKLVDDDQPAGSHRVIWDGSDNSGRRVASGVYLYRLRAAGQSVSKTMTLIK